MLDCFLAHYFGVFLDENLDLLCYPAFLTIQSFHCILQAHFIKDRRCNTAKAIFALESEYKWALSGTPLQNRVGELYSLVCNKHLKYLAYFLYTSLCVLTVVFSDPFFANISLLELFLQGLQLRDTRYPVRQHYYLQRFFLQSYYLVSARCDAIPPEK